MFQKRHWKPAILAGLLLLMLLGISGCLSKPDNTEPLPSESGNILPFVTTTPSPTPAPSDAQGGEGGEGFDSFASDPNVVTSPPTPLPTIGLITASPAPSPSGGWTYSPAPTATPTPKPTDDGTLRHGSTGTAVRNLQQRLKDLGYYSGSVDGDFGSGTESALKDFQRVNGLTADGIAGSRTLSAINSKDAKAKPSSGSGTSATATRSGAYATSRPTPKSYTPSTPGKYGYLENGSSGTGVTNLQNRLKSLGYFNGTVNGRYGDDTEAAVRAFQERNGQWVDGKAGPDTQEALYSDDALPAKKNSNDSVPSTGYRTLASGASGDDVTLLQTRLQELGYYAGSIDGQYGTSTATAVKLFQQYNGITADGEAGNGTLARVYSANALYAPDASNTQATITDTLEVGSMGDAVYSLQERLYDLGYYTGRIDGIYSEEVATAVRAFQTASKLTVDGKAGRTTQTRVYSENAVAASGTDNTYATLRQGDEGERVRVLQSMLSSYGYYTGEVTGIFDLSTLMAVQQFQAQNGLISDGIAGPATMQLLYQGTPQRASTGSLATYQASTNYTTLRQGSTGPDVTVLQQFLQEFGYYDGEQNGTYDAYTLIAVQAFQSRNGLNADGVAGNETLALLYSGNAVPSEDFGQMLYGTLFDQAEQTERTTMREGDEGQDVFTMQEQLLTLGYLTSAPDGKYGSSTTSAVRAFQGRNGLQVDGIAGKETVSAMYSANVISMASTGTFAPVNNSNRELEEQKNTGAIQASLAGGGVAASYGSSVYYVGSGGTLYVRGSSGSRQLYDGKAAYIHASERGVTFVSGNKVLRVPTGGGKAETLATVSGIKKLSVTGDTLLYLDGSALMRQGAGGEPQVLATGVNDFTLDVYQYTVYVASATGIRRIGVNGSGEELIVSTVADQVQIADSIIFFRSGGKIYRMQEGISRLLLDASASWMGIYRDQIFYISGGKLYRCDTDGQNNAIFYDGTTADVSFVAGRVYISDRSGGEVKEIIDVGEATP